MATREQRVTPLELFFDLVFVVAITQVTLLMSDDPTWLGLGRALLVLAALWWAWTGYAWLTNTLELEEGLVRGGMLGAMAALLVVALAVPGAFDSHGVLFGVAYLIVRLLHLQLYAIAGKRDPDLLTPGIVTASVLGIVAVAALWWRISTSTPSAPSVSSRRLATRRARGSHAITTAISTYR